MMTILGGIAALVTSGLVVFFEMWTVLPAPTIPTLALAALVPELSPWGVVAALAAGLIAQFAARGWARTVGVLASAAALGLALLPLLLLPTTIAACNREMRQAFGAQIVDPPLPPAAVETPYRLRVALTGFRPPHGITIMHDLPVITRDGTRLGLDVYAPPGAGVHPTVVLVYGGAWIFGSRTDDVPLGRALAALGYTAVAVDYRHAPKFEFPTQIDDVRDALATVARHAGAWHVDSHRVAMLGRSAGAELALLAAYEPEPLTIRAAAGYYAPTDLIAGYRSPPSPDPANVDRILRAYLGGSPDDRPGRYLAASPVDLVRPGLPPTLLISGERDELVRPAFGRELRDRLRRAGVRVADLDLPWSNHAFDSVPNGTGGQIARYYTERFLAATL